jgi:hypothetical protein
LAESAGPENFKSEIPLVEYMVLSAGIWIPHGGDGESFWYMTLMSG